MMKEKLNSRKGFTLAELLVVVAIIAVLAAIAIPIFSASLEKSAEATDIANLRAAYADITVMYLQDKDSATGDFSILVPAKQSEPNWQCNNGSDTYPIGNTLTHADGDGSSLDSDDERKDPSAEEVQVTAKTKGESYSVSITAAGKVEIK